MTDAQAALAQVREALAAGPTPREWYVRTNRHPTTSGRSWGWLDAAPPGGPQRAIAGVRVEWEGGDTSAVNARYLAACSPANIAAILAHVDAQAAEIERLTAERDEARIERDAMADVLPGYYYMDPPDGGDVPVLEQLRRMSRDAARYRLLRRKFAIISDGEGHAEFCPINLPRPTYIAPNAAIELDTALDRERLGLDGTRPPTPVGWSDTDWIKRLQEQEKPHPLAGQHINQGSLDAAADAYEAEYSEALKQDAERAKEGNSAD